MLAILKIVCERVRPVKTLGHVLERQCGIAVSLTHPTELPQEAALLNRPRSRSGVESDSHPKGRPMRSPFIISLTVLALSGLAHAQSTPPAASAPQFIEIDDDALLSSRVIGLNVQNADGESLGTLEDVALEGGQLVGVVLSVGEVLGQGQRYVAVDPSSISINYTERENKWKATLNAKINQLKAAPEFRYEGKWQR